MFLFFFFFILFCFIFYFYLGVLSQARFLLMGNNDRDFFFFDYATLEAAISPPYW